MNSIQFQMIMKIINNGVPALADELCTAVALVCEENEKLKAEIEALKMPTKPAEEKAEAPFSKPEETED